MSETIAVSGPTSDPTITLALPTDGDMLAELDAQVARLRRDDPEGGWCREKLLSAYAMWGWVEKLLLKPEAGR